MTHDWRSFSKAVAVNALVLAGAWLLLFVLSRLIHLATNAWYVVPVAALVVVPVAVAAARRYKASVALLVILGCGVWTAVEAVAFAAYGVGVIRGRVPHLSVLAGALIGVGLGFIAAKYWFSPSSSSRRPTEGV